MLRSKVETVISTVSANVCHDDLEVLRQLLDVTVPLDAGGGHVVMGKYQAGARANDRIPDLEIALARKAHRDILALDFLQR